MALALRQINIIRYMSPARSVSQVSDVKLPFYKRCAPPL